ncbi:hypothetical protein [Spirosoma luteum]|uniref:hypothetical protein n=1 Tax=Spirosoma luteum TaxID=431553 RepID=UPI000377C86A|nr:hypothetical protein [Spirosoma luteum]
MDDAKTIKRLGIEDEEIEIRLTDIVQFFKKSQRHIFLGVLIGLLIGGLYAFSKQSMYTAQVTVMPEVQSKGAGSLGSLGSLAGLAGISLDNLGGQDAIRPDLYPNVLQSVPFALDLLEQPVYSQKLQTKVKLYEFTRQVSATDLFGSISSLFSSKNVEISQDKKSDPKNFSKAIQVTKEQDELIKGVQESVSATYDKKTGIITIVAIEPDPVVAATVARLSLEYLTNYITTYRTEKARKQVDFLVQQVSEAKAKYQAAEYALSAYRDRNRNLFLESAKIGEQRLQADYLLTQSVNNELSKQLEQAKIKVQEETPIFKTLEPPIVPLRKSGPKRMLIILGFGVAGAFFSMVIVLVRLISRQHPNPAA